MTVYRVISQFRLHAVVARRGSGMTQLTVKALSEEIGTPVDRLLEQLADGGKGGERCGGISTKEGNKKRGYVCGERL